MEKIFYFGNEQLAQGIKQTGAPIFEALIASGYKISALILSSKNPRRELAIEKIAKAQGIAIYYGLSRAEILELIKVQQPAVGILAAYGKLIPKQIIEAFPHKILNIHPSRLPKYRGTTPIETAIMSGDTETAVSIMQLSPKTDAGDIYAQRPIKIMADDDKQSLYEKIAKISAQTLMQILPDYLAGTAKGVRQNDAEATFTQKLSKADGELKPQQESASSLLNKIRAFGGFPKPRIKFNGQDFIVKKAHVGLVAESVIDQLCADGKYLVMDEIIPPNAKAMSPKAYLNGLKNRSLK